MCLIIKINHNLEKLTSIKIRTKSFYCTKNQKFPKCVKIINVCQIHNCELKIIKSEKPVHSIQHQCVIYI